ncbi:MAG: hypothetical protein ACRECV_15915 [Xanthobacteraceae bacterium]
MHETMVLLKRLKQIAAQPSSCEKRTATAHSLVKTFIASFYTELGIGGSNRLTESTKSFADDALVDLRRGILAAEIRTESPSKSVFTAARHHTDMIRRVLSSRLLAESAPAADRAIGAAPAFGWQNSGPSGRYRIRFQEDWLVIAAIRGGADGREQIARSRAAIQESLRLLGTDAAGRRLGKLGYDHARRARLGNLSGQFTM